MGPGPGALFSRFDLDRRESVVVGVSGGGDSLALLFLLKSFLDSAAPRIRLVAATVDHGLRPESTAEAAMVAALCGRHGIAHRTLAWTGEKPRTGLIAAARDARHGLLAQAAADAGTDLVLTGHTLDDQAETVAMRMRRRGDGEGLAGMAPATLHRDTVWFCRPLLGVRRKALREHLARIGVGWIDDPSNENPAFERVRVRSALGEAEGELLAARAAEAARRRTVLAGEAGGLIDRFAMLVAPGLFRVDPAMLDLGPPPPLAPPRKGEGGVDLPESPSPLRGGARGGGDAIVLALRAVLATAGGTPHLPDRSRVEALAERLAHGPLRATLSRAVVDARRNGVWIRREARGLPEMPLSQTHAVWDGRWRIAAGAGRDGLRVAQIGRAAVSGEAEAPADTPQSLVCAALSAEPGVFDAGGCLGHAGSAAVRALGVAAACIVAPHAAYLPSFDLALGDALRQLAGLPSLPRPPWKDHIATGA